MLTGLDHVVILVPELDRAVGQYEALGFTVARGGRHSTGTHNALIALSDGSYLELLAFLDPNPSHRWWPTIAQGGGLGDVAIMSDDLDSDIARFAATGIVMEPPRAMSRTRPDGTELRWRLSVPQPPFSGVVPFLIQDLTSVALRRPGFRGHANGVSGLRAIRWTAGDPAAAAALFARLLSRAAEPMAADARTTSGARFRLDGLALELLPAAGASTAAEPCGLALHSLALEGRGVGRTPWHESDTGGVRIELVDLAG